MHNKDVFDLLPKTFVVLDLETTGLSHAKHEIFETGAIKLTLGESDHPTFQVGKAIASHLKANYHDNGDYEGNGAGGRCRPT